MSDYYTWSQIQRALFADGWRHSTKRIVDSRRDLDGSRIGEDATVHTWAREDERLTVYYVPADAETDGYLTFWPESLSEVSASIHVAMATPELVGARLVDLGAIRAQPFMEPDEGNAFVKELQRHPHRKHIVTAAESMYDLDGENGTGAGMWYWLFFARDAVNALADMDAFAPVPSSLTGETK